MTQVDANFLRLLGVVALTIACGHGKESRSDSPASMTPASGSDSNQSYQSPNNNGSDVTASNTPYEGQWDAGSDGGMDQGAPPNSGTTGSGTTPAGEGMTGTHMSGPTPATGGKGGAGGGFGRGAMAGSGGHTSQSGY